MSKNKKYVLAVILIALVIKLSLFFFMVVFSPQGKFQPDSTDYLKTGEMLASQGVFALEDKGELRFELFRTPGYPFFLCILHYLMKIPLEGVIFLQILLAVSAALITYKAALEIDIKAAFLSAVIVLYSPPITIFSLQILSEILYLFLISMFMLAFIRYLKNREAGPAVLSAVFLALATYVRPISYYLCPAMAVFIVYANIRGKFWRGVFHALIFFAIAYGFLCIWQLRNYLHFHQYVFTNIQTNYRSFPMFEHYAKGEAFLGKDVAPIFSYINAAWHCFLSLMTRPGSLKYLHNYPLTVISKIIGYPFVIFWWIGFVAGLTKVRGNIYYQFLLCVISYFIIITIAGMASSCGERYLIPIIPLIALISAGGWMKLKDMYMRWRER